jgi:hypothetical protein
MSNSSNVHEIAISLNSTKSTDRAKGVKQCEDLIFREQSSNLVHSHHLWSDILQAVYKYQFKELDAKTKASSTNIYAIVKKVVRHVVTYHSTVLTSKMVNYIIETSLDILSNDIIAEYVHNEQVLVLIELLAPSVQAFLSMKCLQVLWKYVLSSLQSQLGKNNKSRLDSQILKLASKMFKSCFRRDNVGFGFSDEILSVISNIMQSTTIDIASNLSLITTCISITTSLIEIDGVNLYESLKKYSISILRGAVCILEHCWSRDNIRDQCLQYLQAHIRLFHRCAITSSHYIAMPDSISDVLDSCLEVLFADDHVKSSMSSSYSSGENNPYEYICVVILYLLDREAWESSIGLDGSDKEVSFAEPPMKRLRGSVTGRSPSALELTGYKGGSSLSTPLERFSGAPIASQMLAWKRMTRAQIYQSCRSSYEWLWSRVDFFINEYKSITGMTAVAVSSKSSLALMMQGYLTMIASYHREFVDAEFLASEDLATRTVVLEQLLPKVEKVLVDIFSFSQLDLQLVSIISIDVIAFMLELSDRLARAKQHSENILKGLWIRILSNTILSRKFLSSFVNGFHSQMAESLINVLKAITVNAMLNDDFLQQSFFRDQMIAVLNESRLPLSSLPFIALAAFMFPAAVTNSSIQPDLHWFPLRDLISSSLNDAKAQSLLLKLTMENVLSLSSCFSDILAASLSRACKHTVIIRQPQTKITAASDDDKDSLAFTISALALPIEAALESSSSPRRSDTSVLNATFLNAIRLERDQFERTCQVIAGDMGSMIRLLHESKLVEDEENTSSSIANQSSVQLRLGLWTMQLYGDMIVLLSEIRSQSASMSDNICIVDLQLPWLEQLLARLQAEFAVIYKLSLQLLIKSWSSFISSSDIKFYVGHILKLLRQVMSTAAQGVVDLDGIHELIIETLRLLVTKSTKSRLSSEDAMDFSTSSNPPSSNTQSSREIKDRHDISFDDDMDIDPPPRRGPSLSNRSSHESELFERVQFGSDDLSIVSLLVDLLYLTRESLSHHQPSINVLRIIEVSNASSTHKRSYNSQTHLSIAHAMINHSGVRQTFEMALNSRWDEELGCLGYCHLLEFILCFIPALLAHRTDRAVMGNAIASLVFAEEVDGSKIDIFPRMHWRCRALQLDCISVLVPLILSENINCRTDVANIVKAAITDADYRVRIRASTTMQSILKLFERKDKIYDTILSASKIACSYDFVPRQYSLSSEQQSLTWMNLACSTLLVTAVGSSTPTLYYRCFADLMILCLLSTSNLVASKYLLHGCLDILRACIGHVDIPSLIRDNLSWLLTLWTRLFRDCPSLAAVDNGKHSELSLFPWYLLSDSLTGDEYLSQCTSLVVTSIVEVYHEENLRLEKLNALLAELRRRSSNDEVNKLIQENSCILQAQQILDERKVLMVLSTRSFSISDLIYSLVELSCYTCPDASFLLEDASSQLIRNRIETSIMKIGELFRTSSDEIWTNSNILDILSHLHRRCLDSRCISTFRTILCVINSILSSSLNKETILRGVIAVVFTWMKSVATIIVEDSDLKACFDTIYALIDALRMNARSKHLLRNVLYELVSYYAVFSETIESSGSDPISEDVSQLIQEYYQLPSEKLKRLRNRREVLSSIAQCMKHVIVSADENLSLQVPLNYLSVLSRDLQSRLRRDRWTRSVITIISSISHVIHAMKKQWTQSPLMLWMEVLNLEDELGPFQGNIFDLWRQHIDELSDFLSSIVEFLGSSSLSIPSIVKDRLSFIMGSLSFPDVFLLSQSSIPSNSINRRLSGEPHVQLCAHIVDILSSQLWNYDVTISNSAAYSLRSLGSTRSLENLLSNAALSNALKELAHSYSINQIALPNQVAHSHALSTINANEISIWRFDGRGYEHWIKQLVRGLLDTLSEYPTPDDHQNSKLGSFLLELRSIANYHCEIAELVFPLVLYWFQLTDVTASTLSTAIAQSISSLAAQTKNGQSSAQKSLRLLCRSINYLITQNIQKFTFVSTDSKKSSASSSSSSKRSAAKISLKSPTVIPFGLTETTLAAASSVADLPCTTIYMIELYYARKLLAYPYEAAMIDDHDHELLFKAAELVHDADFIHGYIPNSSLFTQAALFSHDGMLIEALSNYEGILSSKNSNHGQDLASSSALKTLKALGYDFVHNKMATALRKQDAFPFDAARALSSWNNDIDLDLSSHEGNISSSQYQELCSCLDSYDYDKFVKRLQNTCRNLADDITKHAYDEHGFSIARSIIQIQHLVEIREVSIALMDTEPINQSNLVSKWQQRHSSTITYGDRSIISLRYRLLEKMNLKGKLDASSTFGMIDQVVEKFKYQQNVNGLVPLFYRFRSLLTDQASSTPGATALSMMDQSMTDAKWSMRECRMLWHRGMQDMAMFNLQTKVIKPSQRQLSDPSASDSLLMHCKETYSEATRLGGEWLNQRHSATANVILSDYFDRSSSYATTAKQRLKTSKSLANFHYVLYQNIRSKMNDSEWLHGATVAAERQKELERVKQQKSAMLAAGHKGAPKEIESFIRTLQVEIENDTNERRAVEESVSVYLLAAIKHYGNVLTLSPDADYEAVSQLINLWFENSDKAHVNLQVQQVMKNVATYKFLPLTYQLFSRLGLLSSSSSSSASASAAAFTPSKASRKASSSSTAAAAVEASCSFQDILHAIIRGMCADHPYHTLPQLFALAHEQEKGVAVSTSSTTTARSDRCQAAIAIVANLRHNKDRQPLIESYELLLLSYIDLASTSVKKYVEENRTKNIAFSDFQLAHLGATPFNEIIGKLPEQPAILTINHAIQADKDYAAIVKYHFFSNSFDITDQGLSRPKIIKCIGIDGQSYTQLVKGGDDTRQDAVMEQVFEFVNATLMSDDQTRSRRLLIRTYKIVPLSPQTGVLQFVDNTRSLGSYLVETKSAAHERYRPQDWKHTDCRSKLRDTTQREMLPNVYREVCENFHPVFRWFFFERYLDPVQWMTCRLAYTKSLAAMSVVGHILGIGDRHLQNILLDVSTGEVVHIDFGFTFEQAKTLPVPELVPFRLTRDLVDGMGISGCEGTYRRSCEQVLRMLRENISQLLTILEVVIHDPLYKWCLSPEQLRLKQQKTRESSIQSSIDENLTATGKAETSNRPFSRDAAERTLRRIIMKIRGFEDPTGEAFSVPGQIGFIMNEARDPDKLCRMFVGWAPWV